MNEHGSWRWNADHSAREWWRDGELRFVQRCVNGRLLLIEAPEAETRKLSDKEFMAQIDQEIEVLRASHR